MRVLLVGTGRMGLRHLAGIAKCAREIVVVFHRQNIADQVHRVLKECGYDGDVRLVSPLETAIADDGPFDAAILSAVAENRAERFAQIVQMNIQHILLEKPLEQSRDAIHRMQVLASQSNSDVRCNHMFREHGLFDAIRNSDAPFHMTVNAGAVGLACVGIHWIDLALYMAAGASGRLIHGTVSPRLIASGRGERFQDFGGHGLYVFEDGSSLFLSVDPESSASVVTVITQQHRQIVMDSLTGMVVHEREARADHPNYLYGQDYATQRKAGLLDMEVPEHTRLWLSHVKGERVSMLPTMTEAVAGHHMLFDLLETGGDKTFPIT